MSNLHKGGRISNAEAKRASGRLGEDIQRLLAIDKSTYTTLSNRDGDTASISLEALLAAAVPEQAGHVRAASRLMRDVLGGSNGPLSDREASVLSSTIECLHQRGSQPGLVVLIVYSDSFAAYGASGKVLAHFMPQAKALKLQAGMSKSYLPLTMLANALRELRGSGWDVKVLQYVLTSYPAKT